MTADPQAESPRPARKGAARPGVLGLLVALAYLVPALFLLPDYGPTWDCVMGDYPFGERLLGYLETKDERFLDLRLREPSPRVRSPHPDFDFGRFGSHQVFPLGAFLSALSCRLLWTEAGLVPAMVAHHLPVVLFAALLVGVTSWFAASRLGTSAGLAAGAFLALSPRFFADSFNNPKDVPEACLYTLGALAGLRALQGGRARHWVLAGALAGLGLAQKQNALFLPLQLGLLWALARLGRASAVPLRLSARGVLVALGAFLVAWFAASPPFWSSPLEGPRSQIAQILAGGLAPRRTVSLEAPHLVLVTTPIPLLLLAALGVFSRSLTRSERVFVLVGAALPVARNLIPGMRNYDGVRHFHEFLPFFCVLGALGLDLLGRRLRPPLRAALLVLALLPGALAVVRTHPNGVAYFNALIGGLEGAQARRFSDATDYWGNSYWQGFAWLDEHAEPGALLLVPVAEHVARAAAPVRMRRDLAFHTVGRGPERDVIYVMTITRRGFYGPFMRALERASEPVHEIRVQGGTVLEIYRLGPDTGGTVWQVWERQRTARESTGRVLNYLRERPELMARVRSLVVQRRRLGAETLLEELRPLLPAELQEDLGPALWTLFEEAP